MIQINPLLLAGGLIGTVSALLSWVHDPAFREAFIADRGCPAARRFLAMLSSQVFSAQKTE